MLRVTLDEENSIAILEPQGALSKDDFVLAAEVIDPFIEKGGILQGIIIYVKDFSGWDSFKALLKHFEFVKEHHKKVAHVAFVTDSLVGEFAEHIGRHFVQAEVKNFSFDALEEAKQWIQGNKKNV